MTQELTNPQKCLVVRGDIEFWLDESRAEKLVEHLKASQEQFVKIDGDLINRFEIVGIFTPSRMDERRRRKNGQWTCKFGTWHDKNTKCECKPIVGKEVYRVPELGVEFVAEKRGTPQYQGSEEGKGLAGKMKI